MLKDNIQSSEPPKSQIIPFVNPYLTFWVGFHLSEGSSPLCGSSTGGWRIEMHTSPFYETQTSHSVNTQKYDVKRDITSAEVSFIPRKLVLSSLGEKTILLFLHLCNQCWRFFFKRLYIFICERKREWARGRERESEADSALIAEPNEGFNPTTMRSCPEPKPRVNHSINWGTQAPQRWRIIKQFLYYKY